MRKYISLLALGMVLTLGIPGCVMVIKGEPCRQRVIKVDGEYYVIDEETHTAEKVDKEDIETGTVIMETESDK